MGHHHNHSEFQSSKKLYMAVFINLVLTLFQIVGGILSGSLSLLADALHNFSDAGALIIAAVAARIAKIPPNQKMTYGYKRAEILGALINSTTLVIVGFYLIYEAVLRYLNPSTIDGWTVVIVATVALVIDLMTALLTFSGAKNSMNIKAAFIHNISDAAASLVVIVSGVLIILYKIYLVDLIATILVAIYVLVHAFILIRRCILILMQSTPEHLNVATVKSAIEAIQWVKEAYHIHIWQLDDNRIFLEGHIVIAEEHLNLLEQIKANIRQILHETYSISHTTLELETKKVPGPLSVRT
ncbi:MAG: cation transporter [Bdellovibrionales bacterium]|nr:cation transporter [Bdellovibrionales bacterium]